MAVPQYNALFNPLLQAVRNLGGSASIVEQEDEVASILKLSEADLAKIHKGSRTKFSYNLAWARTYLKQYGLLENSARGVWALTAKGQETTVVDEDEVVKFVKRKEKRAEENEAIFEEGAGQVWEEKLLDCVREISPEAFERLCQRLLREAGFIQVEVTGRSGDGGIDGKGVVRLGGLLSFHMIFQCKRFKGSVGSSIVRDFRGAMVGRADKGLLITTGTFTKDARQEAQREGAPPIDLIDGEALAEKLKELRMGVMVNERVVEDVIINEQFFKDI